MKLLPLFLLLTGCAHFTQKEVVECIDDQTKLYGDLCAEESSGYEYMTGTDAHYEGVKCAAEYIKSCLGEE